MWKVGAQGSNLGKSVKASEKEEPEPEDEEQPQPQWIGKADTAVLMPAPAASNATLLRLRRCCHVSTRAIGMILVVAAVAFLIFLHFDASNRVASVGIRMTVSFNRCWPKSPMVAYRCDWQIAWAFMKLGPTSTCRDGPHPRNVYNLQFKDTIAFRVAPSNESGEPARVPRSGRWEGGAVRICTSPRQEIMLNTTDVAKADGKQQ
eukprot:Skav218537  [mRNA]  locus=scaffold2478:554668:557787:- [translate_table: standard]